MKKHTYYIPPKFVLNFNVVTHCEFSICY